MSDTTINEEYNNGYATGYKVGRDRGYAKGRAKAIDEILSWMDDNQWVEKELLEYLEQLKEKKE